MNANIAKSKFKKYPPALFLVIFLLVSFFTAANFAQALYVYDQEAEERRNARQDPDNNDFRFDKKEEKKRNKKQDVDNKDFRVDRERERERNERQDPKNAPAADAFPPERTPFVDMFVKDFSGVKTRTPFTEMFVQDFSGVKTRAPFTERFVRDFSDVRNNPPFTRIFVRDFSRF